MEVVPVNPVERMYAIVVIFSGLVTGMAWGALGWRPIAETCGRAWTLDSAQAQWGSLLNHLADLALLDD